MKRFFNAGRTIAAIIWLTKGMNTVIKYNNLFTWYASLILGVLSVLLSCKVRPQQKCLVKICIFWISTLLDFHGPKWLLYVDILVLHCGDIPEISNSTYNITSTPWLPGTNVIYSCVDDWMFKNSRSTSIQCQLDNATNTAKWTDQSQIRCIPGTSIFAVM